MSEKNLNLPFDIHGGGLDLIFPHHENEIAQSCGAYGQNNNPQFFAKYWTVSILTTFATALASTFKNEVSILNLFRRELRPKSTF